MARLALVLALVFPLLAHAGEPSPLLAPRQQGRAIGRPVFFKLNRRRVRNRFRDQLRTVADTLRRRPDLSVRIEGDADISGPELWNLILALHRAKSVAQLLIDAGVSEDQLRVVAIERRHAQRESHDRRVDLIVEDNPSRLTAGL